MKKPSSCFAAALLLLPLLRAGAEDHPARPATFCNPMDLAYRFQLLPPVRREAADPTVVVFRNEYWLFPSKSGGYWHSPDCLHWFFVACTSLPEENYAPTVEVVNGKLLWTAGGVAGIFTTDDPSQDRWTHVASEKIGGDPDIFKSTEGRLYLYTGCSDTYPINGVELDRNTFLPIGKPVPLIAGNQADHGWEAVKKRAWFEGSWMNEHDGIFYLQYASPGTEIREYGDGVYTAKAPLGPFTFAPYSPFSYKPTGFATGAGHSSTFKDLSDRYWHVCTVTISVRHTFERRLALYPSGFTSDGQLYCNTYMGDYPQYAPAVPGDHAGNRSPGWMLLSYRKPAEASSTLANHPVTMAFDENIRDWWSAATGDKGEWLKVDLGKPCRIEAIQTNFADQDAQAFGILKNDGYSYTIETSADQKAWKMCVDRSGELRDSPHEYIQLPAPVTARYVRITNVHSPADSKFSISGFRIFGNGLGTVPAMVDGMTATRSATDPRLATITWNPVKNADFYIVRYGLAPDRLFTNYQVYDGTMLNLNALNRGVSYVVTVDAVNDSGVTRGLRTVPLP